MEIGANGTAHGHVMVRGSQLKDVYRWISVRDQRGRNVLKKVKIGQQYDLIAASLDTRGAKLHWVTVGTKITDVSPYRNGPFKLFAPNMLGGH